MSQESSNASVAVAASIGSFMEEAWMTKSFLSDEWRCCRICLEGLNCEEADEEVTLPCKHKFHSACIQTWLAKRDICPLCGINVKPAVQLCRINVKPDVPAMTEENDEINVWVNMITNMAQLWHFDSL
ncbi:E3 ubiquitin-protein ligase SDIR1-like [Pyrus ussuriensis x Pyrus communis]|uniref:E3 ubiquitin-protein ligase SDIR1-like n=1 Tax=Pyrus ussuriensis x Pyrus communis TaxID=2448454 RepID=A0A5N5GEY8_9ROSA|nr:E3 ubiquitin-protein ligase SDIR1-like [Pyrus ussuriensis x Pyrus communis]